MSIIETIRILFHQPFFVSFLATVTCLCFYYLKSDKKFQKKEIWIAYTLLFAGTAVIFASTALNRILHPQVWDFTCFYLWGNAAASGYDIYLPEHLAIVYNSVNLPFSHSELHGFVKEIVNVGCAYPPPTILYFLPFGFLSFKMSMILWTIFNFIFVLGSIYLIFDLFFKTSKLNGIFLVSILLFILLPSLSTVSFSQTNFIALFLLLLMKKYSDKGFSGIFLSIAFFTKPYLIIFCAFFLLRLKWKNIFYFIASTLVIIGTTLIIIGKEPFISYIFNNPTTRTLKIVFTESINQSLNAVLLRNSIISLENPLTYFFITVGIMLITGFYLIFLLNRKLYDYIWVILLLVALLIYPGTLSHYGTLLLFVVFQFFDEKEQLGFNKYFTVTIIAVFYYMSTFSVFLAICFLLGLIILKSLGTFNHGNILAKPIQ